MANSTSNSRNLSSLVHELRERIAATSSTPPNNIDSNADDDALETRFRAVLPNLLHAYGIFLGFFYHGKASAVLPVIGRILPFFNEPAFSSRHGVIFETVGPLLSMLRTGSRDAYRMLFIDAMCAIEDILYISSFSSENSRITEATRFTLKCLLRSFSQNLSDSTCLCVLPTSNKPLDGPGILINLLGRNWWQPFATWIIKFLSKCLTEGTLYVEGLMNTSFVSAACSLLCYGDADLQMACFDFARVIGSVMSYDNVPHENLIRSISTILGEDKEGLPVFRNTSYDTCLGGCLRAVHSSCPDDVVKLTAENLVNVFHRSMRRTKSMELKVN
ncbi:serine/threonine-protein kinase ATR-like [Hibiscus syriacus]|uniref:serine/threonine-protein kinase ATR-like n=1 Tax=Hibiscus syriacus TaxID=106335 RepID=UPI0019236A44|nr:serine/threonine-protein kinase ATR-like [Hibiscus syriacus]